MTYEADPLDGSVSYDTRGQWGGLIVLGDASTNFGGPAQVEGIPSDNDRAVYGGSNDADNSGIITYVSVPMPTPWEMMRPALPLHCWAARTRTLRTTMPRPTWITVAAPDSVVEMTAPQTSMKMEPSERETC